MPEQALAMLEAGSNKVYIGQAYYNGIGIPFHVKEKKRGSLAINLTTGLSEDLDGNLSIENKNGTTVKIFFVHEVKTKRPETTASSFITSN